MAQYISKAEAVEARQYDGEQPLTVVNDDRGEMRAYKGDWLVGNERGKVYVMSDGAFNARFQPYAADPEGDALKTAQLQVASLTSDLITAKANVDALIIQVHQLEADKADIGKQVGDTQALSGQVADLTAKLQAANDKAAADEQKLADLAATIKTQQDAQKAIDTAQAKLNQL
jgi:predicted  nucleic acid-binding Zn-ribbon protein